MDRVILPVWPKQMLLWNYLQHRIISKQAKYSGYGRFTNIIKTCSIMTDFTHIDENGRVTMVDVSHKKISLRTAMARSTVVLPEKVLLKMEGADIQTKKGPVMQTAVIAGIMAAKKTGDLIPL